MIKAQTIVNSTSAAAKLRFELLFAIIARPFASYFGFSEKSLPALGGLCAEVMLGAAVTNGGRRNNVSVISGMLCELILTFT